MVPSDTRAKEVCLALEPSAQQLLPGMPDEVTMDEIASKLSWTELLVLSSVNRGWRHAFQSRQVYNARIRSESTETLVFFNFVHSENSIFVVLYSMRKNSRYPLPIPYLDGGIPENCECVILDAKMYVLGGWGLADSEHDTTGADSLSLDHKVADKKGRLGSSAVHVLDLVVRGQWKRCTGMLNRRAQFGCAVFKGKIYVFGGTDGRGPVFESEIYDPSNDTWSPIQPMKLSRVHHRVAVVGKELVVHGGTVVSNVPRDHLQPESLPFYHPDEDKWRLQRGIKSNLFGIGFDAEGKLYALDSRSIQVHEGFTFLDFSNSFEDAMRARNRARSDVVAALDDVGGCSQDGHSRSHFAGYDRHIFEAVVDPYPRLSERYESDLDCLESNLRFFNWESFEMFAVAEKLIVEPFNVAFVDGELLARVGFYKIVVGSSLAHFRRESTFACLFRSKGFGRGSIEWEEVPSSSWFPFWPVVDNTRYFMSTIQL